MTDISPRHRVQGEVPEIAENDIVNELAVVLHGVGP
jgi:hypothetical protein